MVKHNCSWLINATEEISDLYSHMNFPGTYNKIENKRRTNIKKKTIIKKAKTLILLSRKYVSKYHLMDSEILWYIEY